MVERMYMHLKCNKIELLMESFFEFLLEFIQVEMKWQRNFNDYGIEWVEPLKLLEFLSILNQQ